MKLKDIKSVFGSKKNDQLKIRSKKDKNIKRKLTSTMSKKLNRMNGIICDPSKSVGLETELTLSPAITVHYTSKIVDVAKVMSVKDNTTCVLVIDDRGQLCGKIFKTIALDMNFNIYFRCSYFIFLYNVKINYHEISNTNICPIFIISIYVGSKLCNYFSYSGKRCMWK